MKQKKLNTMIAHSCVIEASFDRISGSSSILDKKETGCKTLSIFPNPATESINLSGATYESTWLIYNKEGQIIYEGIGKVCNVDFLPAGFYYVMVTTKEKNSVGSFFKE